MSLVFSLFKLFTHTSRIHFEKSLQNPQRAQDKALRKIKKINLKWRIDHPTTNYLYYEDRIENLTTEPVEFFETTSGSTSKKKKIPFNRSLLETLDKMYLLWVNDILTCAPVKLKTGVFFMAISPDVAKKSQSDDRKFITSWLSKWTQRYQAVDSTKLDLSSNEKYFKSLAAQLKNRKDLEVISVWSPTYLLKLLELMEEKPEWPELKMISCWDSAASQESVKLLKEKFPSVWFQGKGLLATEAPLSMPWIAAKGCVPLLEDIYFEFIDKNKNIFKLHELQIDSVYEVLITTPGGLIRYQLGDLVKVTHFYQSTPCFEFIGRTQDQSDLVGEKLSESLIRETLGSLFPDGSFYCMLPSQDRYILFCDQKPKQSPDEALQSIYHYQVARGLEQLKPLEVFQSKNLRFLYLDFYSKQGMNLGDIKEKVLISQPALAQSFYHFVQTEGLKESIL